MPHDVEIVSLGGAGGFGMNATLVASGGRSLLIDCGIGFPHPGLPGVARLAPDPAPLAGRFPAPGAIVLTHGHDDHVAGLPWLPPSWRSAPVYGTPLTLALARDRFDDAGVPCPALRAVRCGERFEAGAFPVELVAVNHSLPQSASVAIGTPAGRLLFSGDIRFDTRPFHARRSDVTRLRELGDEGVRALFLDSTGARSEGAARSESDVASALADAVAEARGQVFVSIFSSHMERLQAVLAAARGSGRGVALLGRRLARMLAHGTDLGLLDVPAGEVLRSEDLARRAPRERLFVAGGCQAEPGSSLVRLSAGAASRAAVEPGDTVIISARVIPGNEIPVTRMIDRLLRLGAEVRHAADEPALHASGHGGREELREMLRLVRPRLVIPNHGDTRNLVEAADLARTLLGVDAPVVERGEIVALGRDAFTRCETLDLPPRLVTASGAILGTEAVRARRRMATSGLVVVGFDGDPRETEPWISCHGLAEAPPPERVREAARRGVRRAGRDEGELGESVALAVRRALRDGPRGGPHVVVRLGAPRG